MAEKHSCKIIDYLRSCATSFEYYALIKKNEGFDPTDERFLEGFTRIKTTYSRWIADPFVFKYNLKNYVFAEMGDRVTWRGEIGYYCLDKNKEKWHTCIKEKWHLSFPNIFYWNGDIVMMCESYEHNCIYLYKCVRFPDKWIKSDENLLDGVFVDSDICSINNELFLFAYSIENDENILKIYEFKDDKFFFLQQFEDEKKQLRPAGKVFDINEKKYLPTQNCEKSYGHGMFINELILNNHHFSIIQVKELSIERFEEIYDIKTSHLHTLNHNEDYIVVDASARCKSLYVFFRKFNRNLLNKFKRKKK